jgi:hypothetical protein
VFFVGSVMLIVLLFVLSYYVSLRSLVTCCDVRYDFRIKMMFGSSLLPVVCKGGGGWGWGVARALFR